MRVIAKSTLVKFWSQPDYADAKGALQSWHDEAIKATGTHLKTSKTNTAVPVCVATTGWFLISLATSTV